MLIPDFFILFNATVSNQSPGLALHCVKSVRIRSYSGPYSVRMREKHFPWGSRALHETKQLGYLEETEAYPELSQTRKMEDFA